MSPVNQLFWAITISQILFYFLWAIFRDIAKSDRAKEDSEVGMPCKVFNCRRTAMFESEFCFDHMRYHNNPGLQYEEYPELGQSSPNARGEAPVTESESRIHTQWWGGTQRMIGLECIVKLRTAELAPPLLTLPLIEYC